MGDPPTENKKKEFPDQTNSIAIQRIYDHIKI